MPALAEIGELMETLSELDIAFIKEAARELENPGFAIRAANTLGRPVELGIERLPEKMQKAVSNLTRASLEKAFQGALRTLRQTERAGTLDDVLRLTRRSSLIHTVSTAVTGAAGGAFGFAGLAVELPITTTIMLRAIADIAQECGFDPSRPEIQLECLAILSFGGRAKSDDASETGYYAARGAMTKLIRDAVADIAEAMAKGSAPAIVRLIAAISARFEVVVTEKALLEALPALGAITGAGINVIFSRHYCGVARYHFGLKRLERLVGESTVKAIYDSQAGASR